MKQIALIVTGASGGTLALEAMDALVAQHIQCHVICTEQAQVNFCIEAGMSVEQTRSLGQGERETLVQKLLPDGVHIHDNSSFFSPLASGSGVPDGLVVLPASMGYCARVCQGLSGTLAERVFDVCLKERRPIVVAPRETPLNSIHLENLLKLSQLGVGIQPFMPEFYSQSQGMPGQVRRYIARLLGGMGIELPLNRWALDDAVGCFACGQHNTVGLQLQFEVDAQELQSQAGLRLSKAFASYDGIIHGGILSTVLDEAMGKIPASLGHPMVTCDLQVKFLRPLRVLQQAYVTGSFTHRKWKTGRGESTITCGRGDVIATATGRFLCRV
ncbi:UbiX family flavin prenyltransferase [Desulfurispirillum indicum]|uniref:UbiX family flavin prenyltransferase n=1 Tax=Desulfurispirillum indicum TaxID=936456 RepID=UPI001CF9B5AE|nr:UbiX family flavin prenyltransferase [Desulfurispirillum indicum]UCZ56082.1 UbiX family flavin prenyltransferase [Desulfurispirillum indicum]